MKSLKERMSLGAWLPTPQYGETIQIHKIRKTYTEWSFKIRSCQHQVFCVRERMYEPSNHRVNKIAADGWVRGWDEAGIVCAVCRGSFASQDKGSLLETLSLHPPPQKGSRPSSVKIVCLRPPIRNLQEWTQICYFNTTWAESGVFTLNKARESQRMGPFICRRYSKEAGLNCRPVCMNKVVREFAACGLGAAL